MYKLSTKIQRSTRSQFYDPKTQIKNRKQRCLGFITFTPRPLSFLDIPTGVVMLEDSWNKFTGWDSVCKYWQIRTLSCRPRTVKFSVCSAHLWPCVCVADDDGSPDCFHSSCCRLTNLFVSILVSALCPTGTMWECPMTLDPYDAPPRAVLELTQVRYPPLSPYLFCVMDAPHPPGS